MKISGSYPTLPSIPEPLAGTVARRQKDVHETNTDRDFQTRPVRMSRVAEFEALFAYDNQANFAEADSVRKPQIDEYV